MRFDFRKPEVLRVTLSFQHGIPSEIKEEVNDSGEHYYGIWEMPFGGNIDNRGADWDFLGVRRHRDVNYAAARAPFYMTSKNYGIYVETFSKGHFTITRQGKTTFSFHDTELRYDILYGPSFADLLSRYNALAGPAFMPPAWAFSSIWWRDDEHEDLRSVKNAQGKVLDDANQLRALNMPAGAIWLDRPYGTGKMGWGNFDFDASFPDPAKMISDLNDRGMNLLLWIADRAWNDLLMGGLARRYLYLGEGSASDMQSAGAYSWFKSKLNEYVRLGVKGYKIDRGEEDEMPPFQKPACHFVPPNGRRGAPRCLWERLFHVLAQRERHGEEIHRALEWGHIFQIWRTGSFPQERSAQRRHQLSHVGF